MPVRVHCRPPRFGMSSFPTSAPRSAKRDGRTQAHGVTLHRHAPDPYRCLPTGHLTCVHRWLHEVRGSCEYQNQCGRGSNCTCRVARHRTGGGCRPERRAEDLSLRYLRRRATVDRQARAAQSRRAEGRSHDGAQGRPQGRRRSAAAGNPREGRSQESCDHGRAAQAQRRGGPQGRGRREQQDHEARRHLRACAIRRWTTP